jgi:DUF4097 and DUF4098 domain-containing protein YvlB
MIMKKNTIGFAVLAVLASLTLTTAWGQDFQNAYQLAPGGTISVSNVSGEISITGYNGAAVTVAAFREGPDKDMVQIQDQSSPGHVSLTVQYPSSGSHHASVRFVIQVPRASSYQFDSLKSASGDIQVTDVTGDIKAKAASGDITIQQVRGNVQVSAASGDIKITQVEGTVTASAASGDVTATGIAGTVSASTASGDVDVELTGVPSSGDMKFSSASGDVRVKAPAQLNAQVEMSTVSGSVKTDFPLTIEDLDHHGKKAYGQVGTGAIKLKISTASGGVQLIRS